MSTLSAKANPLYTFVARHWHRTTALPKFDLNISATRRYRATLLHWLLISAIAFTLVCGAGLPLLAGIGQETRSETIIICIFCLIVQMVALRLNRAGFYQTAAIITLSLLWLMPNISAYFFTNINPRFIDLRWLAIASLMLTSILFPHWWATLVAGVLNALSAAILSGLVYGPQANDLFNQIIIIGFLTVCAIVIHHHRARLEDEGQITLITTNDRLKQQMDEREQLTHGLTTILTIAEELLVAPDLNSLWAMGLRLARERLNVDRCSIYEYNAATDEMFGTYGVDGIGNLVSEQGSSFKVADSPWVSIAIKNRSERRWEVKHDMALTDTAQSSKYVANGWNAYTLISNRAGFPSAVLFSDNALKGEPFDPINQDLIGVYCSLLGGIAERKRAEAQRDEQQTALRAANDQLTQQMSEHERLTSGLTKILNASDELLATSNLDHLWQRGTFMTEDLGS